MRKLCRFLFSRYAISAFMIGLEIILLTSVVFYGGVPLYITMAASVIFSIVAIVNLINKDANPEYKISWIAVIVFLMPLGAVMYFIFYSRRMSRRESLLLRGAMIQLKGHGELDDDLDPLRRDDSLAAGKARAIMNDDPLAELYRGTSSVFFPTGEKFFEALIADLEMAEKYIFLEYFIIDEGALWEKIHGVLKEKAKAGLDVRVLYDDIGCMYTLPSRYEQQLRREGIMAQRFSKVNPRVSSVHHNRDHRKICVIDGIAAYTGGVNIADEYANVISRFGYWKDGGVRLSGQAVAGFVKLFLSSWDFTARTVSDYERFISEVKPSEDPDGGYYIPFGTGPAPIYKRPVGKNAFLNMINQAERYVYITTPYLIIDYDLTESLCNAAQRGVDVRIITPGVADKEIIKIMTKSAYPHLIDAKVKIYEYTPGFIHEKTMVCDDKYAIVGTINFDFRSLVHHFECAVWMYNTPTVLAARDAFERTASASERMTRKRSRLTFSEWLFRTLIKIFAPLL